jgi:hypothetical protein
MSELISVLRRYGQFQMGRSPDQENRPAIEVGALQSDLRNVVSRSEKFLWVWLVTLIVIFALDCFIVLRELSNPKLIGAIFTATGTGFVVVIAQMRRLWREQFMTETLISLLPALSPAEIKNVVMQLLSVLVKG